MTIRYFCGICDSPIDIENDPTYRVEITTEKTVSRGGWNSKRLLINDDYQEVTKDISDTCQVCVTALLVRIGELHKYGK